MKKENERIWEVLFIIAILVGALYGDHLQIKWSTLSLTETVVFVFGFWMVFLSVCFVLAGIRSLMGYLSHGSTGHDNSG